MRARGVRIICNATAPRLKFRFGSSRLWQRPA